MSSQSLHLPPPRPRAPCSQLADYQRVVDLYKLRWVDFDIEGGAIKEPASVQRRHRVIRRLQVGVDSRRNWQQVRPCARRQSHVHCWVEIAACVPCLQAANPGLTVSFTLPVLPTGLTADGVNMLKDARGAGVRVDVINLMTMDYGDSAAPGGPRQFRVCFC